MALLTGIAVPLSYSLVMISAVWWPEMPSIFWLIPTCCTCIACLLKRRWVLSAVFAAMSVALIQGNLFKYQSEVLFRFGTDITIKAQVDSYFKKISHGYEVHATITAINGHPIPSFKAPKVRLRTPFALEAGATFFGPIQLKRLSGVLNQVGFDREKHAFSQGIVGIATLANKKHSFSVSKYHWRAKAHDAVKVATENSPFQGLYLALVFGDRSMLPIEQRKSLQQSGLSHLIAISGLHIGVIFGMGYWVAKSLISFLKLVLPYKLGSNLVHSGQFWSLSIGLLFAYWYCALGFFAISTVRALIMLGILSLLLLTQVRIHRLMVLLVSAAVVLTLVPFSAASMSFWLSFFAVGALLLTLTLLGKTRGVIAIVSLHLVLSGLFIPLIGFLFHGIPLLSAAYNFVFVPWFSFCIVPLTLLAAAINMMGFSSDCLWFLLDQALLPLDLLLPYASSFWTPIVHNDLMFVVVLLVSVLCFKWLSTSMITVVFLVSAVQYSMMHREEKVSVHFLDVGHGLSVAIVQGDEAVVYDTGRATPTFSMAEAVLIPNLRALGVKRLEGLILSHADNDHAGGEADLKQNMPPRWIRRPEGNSQVNSCIRGERWKWGAVDFEVLWPPAKVTRAYNPHSCVILVTYQETDRTYRLLLTGDIEKVSEILLSRELEPLSIDVMSVPHHGSKTSSSRYLHQTINADYAVASNQFDSRWQLPSPVVREQYQNNGSIWYETGRTGQVTFQFVGQEIIVSTARSDYLAPWYRQMLRSRVE
ncbi:DNA internalization-related competence protein ComEC/Rec2 [Vibrio sp. SCSIO 43140]|uniref:DNA internalization-related competence protein ComEC/Rec2 n=1 Tax=Vibrio sp. SCSIO 43140 TaxID=2819100 RepID=UPI0020750E20|nr:DNA internalization-related competence protein ComEC/Rec2 [Vibrio sp. SCSIO 43140]USD59377.1 DNA internalization-related competence protein ComEC/Rec2 [Vibrio sp. SCSIO 43140]